MQRACSLVVVLSFEVGQELASSRHWVARLLYHGKPRQRHEAHSIC